MSILDPLLDCMRELYRITGRWRPVLEMTMESEVYLRLLQEVYPDRAIPDHAINSLGGQDWMEISFPGGIVMIRREP